jgi:uncharacterized protein YegL
MNADYTHISMIIDRSGSMSTCWNDVIGGYSQIVKDNKEAPGKCTFSVAVFDTAYDLIEDFTGITKVNEKLDAFPRGGTALLDAVGKTIRSVGARLDKMDESERPSKVICIIQTDGEENASTEFTKDSIKSLIEEHTTKYNWQFQFIGASIESVQESRSWGINADNSTTYATSNSLDTFTLLGSKMKSMRAATTPAQYMCASIFTKEEVEQMNSVKS